MSSKTSIEWTEQTWNPIVGCSILSPGCTNCYAMKMAARIQKMNRTGGSGSDYVNHYDGTTRSVNGKPVWTGKLALAPRKLFHAPLHRSKPTMYFVNSMGDLFHEDCPDEWIDRVFAVMALSSRHTFQVLTKRADRMRAYVSKWFERLATNVVMVDHPTGSANFASLVDWSVLPNVLPNVWLGVSTERQQEADERIPHLLQTPAAVRFVSAEPLLGSVNIHRVRGPNDPEISEKASGHAYLYDIGAVTLLEGLDWVIVGGESGPGARPMHPGWARSLRDQCQAAGVPFFFKQWGVFAPTEVGFDEFCHPSDAHVGEQVAHPDGTLRSYPTFAADRFEVMRRLGKAKTGRLLDGVEHNAIPGRAA